jgi:hypothetical protein
MCTCSIFQKVLYDLKALFVNSVQVIPQISKESLECIVAQGFQENIL